jgi:membrane associated rhomboid family serine protease
MSGWGTRFSDGPRAPAIHTIVIACIVVFLIQRLVGAPTRTALSDYFALSRVGVLQEGRAWQLLTYLFLHGGFWHLLMNMVVLVSFGRELEVRLGSWRVLLLYLLSGVLGGVGWLLLSGAGDARCIGASGAVYGVAAAFAALDPEREMTFVVFPIPVPITMTARRMIIAFGVVSLVFLIVSSGNIAHAAHLAGGVGGYLYGLRARRLYQ